MLIVGGGESDRREGILLVDDKDPEGCQTVVALAAFPGHVGENLLIHGVVFITFALLIDYID